MPTAAVEQPVDADPRGAGAAEETDEQSADDSADEVHADDVERVVVTELVLQRDREGADGAGDQAEDDRADRADEAGRRRDRDETRHRTGSRTQRRRVTVAQLLDEDPAEHGSRRRRVRVDEGDTGEVAGSQRRTGVEAEPAEPQQPGTQ